MSKYIIFFPTSPYAANPQSNYHYSQQNRQSLKRWMNKNKDQTKLKTELEPQQIKMANQANNNPQEIFNEYSDNFNSKNKKGLRCICQMCVCGKHKCPPKPSASNRIHKLIAESPMCCTQKHSHERVKTEPSLVTSLRKCANSLLNNSPYNGNSTYNDHFKKYQSVDNRNQLYGRDKLIYDYAKERISLKVGPNQTQQDRKFNKFDGTTTYKAHFTVQANYENGRSYQSAPKMLLSRSNNNVQNYCVPSSYTHRYGKATQGTSRIELDNPINQYYVSSEVKSRNNILEGETQYKKQFARPKETQMFKLENKQRQSYLMEGKSHQRMVTQPNLYSYGQDRKRSRR